MGIQKFLFAVLAVVMLASNLHAVDPPPIDSHLFQSGELVYTDGFDGPLNKKWWQIRTKNWEVVDGLLIGAPDYKNAAEAEKDSIVANLPSFNFEGTAYWVDPVMG